jgi:uncharacterized protein
MPEKSGVALVDKRGLGYIMSIFYQLNALARPRPTYGIERGRKQQRPEMIINVSQISEEEGLTIGHVYPEGEPKLRSDDMRIVARPDLKARVTRAGREVRLAGSVRANVEVDCGRCLSPVSFTVNESFDLFYIPPINSIGSDQELVLAEEDLIVGFYQGDVIDLDDLVREQIELAVPMTRLCSDGCRGLCQKCGANLNEGACGCAFDNIDPRWGALSDLNEKMTRN